MKMEHNFTSRISTPFDLSKSEVETWEKLTSKFAGNFSPFLSLHYIKAVAEAGVDVRVCVILLNDTTQGFFPYQFKNRYYSWSKSAEPVAAPGFSITPEQLLKLAKINHFGFSHLDESQLTYGLIAEQPRIGLRIRLNMGAEHPLDELCLSKHKYLKDTERRARQLVTDLGKVEFNFDVQNNMQRYLEHLIIQKRAQYHRTDARDALSDKWKQKLLSKLSEYQFKNCRGILSTLYAGDQWVASHFGIMGNGVLQYWLPVYNPECSKYAPGRLLIHHIIQSCQSASIHTIDRGEGDTPSKRELTNEEHLFYRGVWHNKTISSLAIQTFNSLKWRLGS